MSPESAKTLQTIRQWQSETDAIREAPEPLAARMALMILTAIVVCVFGMTPFFMMERVVSSRSGKIVSNEPVNTFQALDPSLIKSIDVKEGQIVERGQLLATLDPTFAAADVGQLRQQVAGLDAQIMRAEAEQNKAPLVFPANLPPEEIPYVALQKGLFDQRAATLAAQMRSFDEKIKTTQTTIVKFQADELRYQAREKITHQVEDMRDSLYKSGSSSLLNLLQANDSRLEMLRTMEFGHNSLIEAQHQLSSLTADREAAVQDWFTTSSQELVTARNARDLALASLLKAAKHQDLVRLVASERAVVLAVSQLSVGSVLKSGDALLTLVPLRSPVEAEIHISTRDIGFVRPGDHVTLKIDAFNYFEHGKAEGKLRWISEGSFATDPDDKKAVEPYYKARVSIDMLHFADVPSNFRLVPGMTMTADIDVGSRSIFKYIMGGFLRGVGDDMRDF